MTATAAHTTAPDGLFIEVEQSRPMLLRGRLHCPSAQMIALVGPSGAGKTSWLRCMAGLMRPERGRMTVDGVCWFDTGRNHWLTPQQRHVGLVFQHYALMPHLSALDNVALSMLHLPRAERLRQAQRWLDHVRLTRAQQMRRPAELSGGQQQRVGVARALARQPKLLLLDEPFSAVDATNRQGLYDLLAQLRQELTIPMVIVTHDLSEARHLADQMVVIDGGAVLQAGPPEHIYRAPRNARVADLVGVQNRFTGIWLGPLGAQDERDGMGWLQWTDVSGQPHALRLRVRDKKKIPPQHPVHWVFQGDALHLDADPAPTAPNERTSYLELATTVVQARNLGETTMATLRIDSLGTDAMLRLTRSGPARIGLVEGRRVRVQLDCHWVHVMPIRARPEQT